MVRLIKLGILLNKRWKGFGKLFEFFIWLANGSRINMDITLGKNVTLAYQGMSVLIVKGTIIGDNVVIGPRVTIGRLFPYKRVPSIGSKVWIGANAVIVGPIEVSDNVIIAPQSVVNKSLETGYIYGGIPAKKIGLIEELNYDIFANEQSKNGLL